MGNGISWLVRWWDRTIVTIGLSMSRIVKACNPVTKQFLLIPCPRAHQRICSTGFQPKWWVGFSLVTPKIMKLSQDSYFPKIFRIACVKHRFRIATDLSSFSLLKLLQWFRAWVFPIFRQSQISYQVGYSYIPISHYHPHIIVRIIPVKSFLIA